jgi:hypothetical protein
VCKDVLSTSVGIARMVYKEVLYCIAQRACQLIKNPDVLWLLVVTEQVVLSISWMTVRFSSMSAY